MGRVSRDPAEERSHGDAARPLEELTTRESPLTPLGLLELQRTAGNCAVQRMLAGAGNRAVARFSDQLVRDRAEEVKDWIEAKVQVRAHEIYKATNRTDEKANYFEAKKQVEEAWQHLTTLKSGGVITSAEWEVMRLGLSSEEYATALALSEKKEHKGVAREKLWPSLRVKLGMPVEHKGKLGTVNTVPPQGAVPVRVDGQIVEVDPADLELIPIVVQKGQPKVSAKWGNTWGKVYEVAPGIGVDVRGKDEKSVDETYVDFIVTHLQTVASTPVGAAVLAQFDPREEWRVRTPVTGTGPYEGLSVVISAPPDLIIETKAVRGLKTTGARDFSGEPEDKIPWIKFAEPPQDPIAPNIMKGSTTAKITTGGIQGHADFPTATQQFDVILFHELIHAHLHSTGVGVRLRELGQPGKPPALRALNNIAVPRDANPEDSVEEALVVGIIGGKGIPLSENAYRCQRGYTLRPSYKSVGIDEGQQQVEAYDWTTVATTPTQIKAALVAVGLTQEQAAFVAGS